MSGRSWLYPLLNRIHKTLFYFVENHSADDEYEGDEDAAPDNTHEIKTAGTQKGVAEAFKNGGERIHIDQKLKLLG